jgi:hypothetical protein
LNGKGLYFTTTHLSEKFTFHVKKASNGKGTPLYFTTTHLSEDPFERKVNVSCPGGQ